MLEYIQTALQVIIWFLGVILILLILVQGGAGDLSSTFGGGGQLDSSLGVGASRKMGKLTGWLSVAFLASVFLLAMPTDKAFAEYTADDAEAVDADQDSPIGVEAEGRSLPPDEVDDQDARIVAPDDRASDDVVDPADGVEETTAEAAEDEVEAGGLEIGVEDEADAE